MFKLNDLIEIDGNVGYIIKVNRDPYLYLVEFQDERIWFDSEDVLLFKYVKAVL